MQRIKRMLPIASVRRVGRRRPSEESNDCELLSEAGIVIAGPDRLHPFYPLNRFFLAFDVAVGWCALTMRRRAHPLARDVRESR